MAEFRKSRLGRLATLGGLATRLGGNVVGAAARRVTAGRDKALEALHRRTAEQLFETMGEMKGLPMKVGQILSFMDGVIPAEYQPIYRDLLTRLQAQGQPLPTDQMLASLEAELGRAPDEVFAEFEPEPIASASIGQVYGARLSDGAEVAVKIQYPGIEAAVTSDLRNAKGIVTTLHAVIPNVQSHNMVRDFLDRIREECDYRLEAENQGRFAAAWRDDPRVLIPSVHLDLSTERVIVTDRVDGRSFGQMLETADPATKSAIGETMFWFVFRSILEHGMFNADPHPGNFLFPDDGRVAFIDFGCVQTYDDDTREAFARLITAVLDGARGDDLWAVVAETLQFPDDTSEPLREIIVEYLLFCFEPVIAPQPFRYTEAYTSQLSELTMNAKLKIAKNVLRIGWREPKRQGLILLSRILFGMNSLLASLEAEGDWRELLRAAIPAGV